MSKTDYKKLVIQMIALLLISLAFPNIGAAVAICWLVKSVFTSAKNLDIPNKDGGS